MLGDPLLYELLRVVFACVGVAPGEDHVRQFPRGPDHPLDVDHRGDVASAMADEYAHPRRFVRDVALRGIGLGPHARAARRSQQGHRPGRRGARLHHRIGDVLGLLECAAHEYPGTGRVQGLKLGGLGEAPPVQHDLHPLGLFPQRRAGLQAEGEHDHVELLFGRFHLGTCVDDPKVLRPRHLVGPGDERSQIPHAQPVPRPIVVAVEILAEGAHVEEEHGHVQARHVLLGQDRLLGGGHAADRGAVVVVAGRVARTHALDERQPRGRPAVAGSKNVPPGRARGGEQPLELHVREYVGSEAEAELAPPPRVERLEAGRKNDGTDLQADGFLRLVVVDGSGLADLGAQSALARREMDAVLAVDRRYAGRGLRMGQIDARPGAQMPVEIRYVGFHPAGRDRGQVDRPRGTDERARTARLALVGRLAERRRHGPPPAAAVKADRPPLHQVAADGDAQPAEDALSFRGRLEGGGADSEPGGDSGQFRGVGSLREQQFEDRSPGLAYAVGVRAHDEVVLHRMAARGHLLRTARRIDLHHADPASPVGGEAAIVAERGDRNGHPAGGFEDRRTARDFRAAAVQEDPNLVR